MEGRYAHLSVLDFVREHLMNGHVDIGMMEEIIALYYIKTDIVQHQKSSN